MSRQHTAAIHALAGKLGLSDDARRDVMAELTARPGQPGKRSCTEMSDAERALVRDHLARQAERQGLAQPAASGRGGRMSAEQFAAAKKAASPRERKVWALWHALYRAKLLRQADARALDAWVARTVHVSALRFCTTAQLDTCIEALKDWLKRGNVPAVPTAELAKD